MNVADIFCHTSAKESEIRSIRLPDPRESEVKIESLFSLISTGTEQLVSKGLVPKALYDTMKVPYMKGNFSFPIAYGYSLVARVNAPDSEFDQQIVHVLHPHQTEAVVSVNDLHIIPKGIPPSRAVLASNMETAVNAIWDSRVSVGDQSLIVGFGIIGSLIARLLSMMPAANITVVDLNERRIELAKSMGFKTASPEELEADFDIAFHCSSSSGGLQTCIDKTGFEGKIIELSWYGTRDVQVQLGGSYHSQRKQIISSQVSHIPPSRRARWDYARRRGIALELLKDPCFDAHIEQKILFKNLPQLFTRLRQSQVDALGYCVCYE